MHLIKKTAAFLVFNILFSVALFGSQTFDTVDVTSPDVKTTKFAMTKRMIVTSMLPMEARTLIDLNSCDILEEVSTGYYKLDCTDLIASLTGKPMIKPVIFNAEFTRKFNYDACDYKGPIEYADACYQESYVSQYANCYLIDIEVSVGAQLTQTPFGIGFYNDGQISYIPLSSLEEDIKQKSESARVYMFSGLSKCWAGSMSSSLNWKSEMKPFVYKESGDVLMRYWENIELNYVISEKTPTID